jgi:aminopeptidase N
VVNGQPAAIARHGQELVITPRATLAARAPLRIEVVYSGVPHAVIDPDGSLDGWVATDDGAVLLSEPQGSPSWFPVNDYPTDKATFTISMTVPAGLDVVSNGPPVGETRQGARTTHVWSEREPMAPYLATVAIGNFDVTRSTTSGGIPIIDATDPRLTRGSRAALAKVGPIIDWESSLFGPYPFESVGATADYAPEVGYALETQTRPTFTFPIDTLSLVHELAHQWFGDSVSLRSWPEMWLNEGFATYTEWLWIAHTGGRSVQQLFLEEYHSIPANDPFWKIAPSPATLPSAVDLFGEQVYLRGAMALQGLRDTVGDAPFFAILREWASVHRYGNGDTAQFVSLAERVAGVPLHAWLHAWLEAPRRPLLPG